MSASGDAKRLRILDVGCGIHKQPGSIGIDRNPASRADVLADLDHFPYPFADSSFDRLTAIHVIEHVDDVIRTMEEFHRLVRNGGTVRIETPHYTDFSSFCDPTHKHPSEQLQLPLLRRESRRLRLLLAGALSRACRAREAAGLLAVSGISVPGQSFPALSALLGTLPVLHRSRESNGIRVRSVEVSGCRWKPRPELVMVAMMAAQPTQPSAIQKTAVSPQCPATAPATAELAATNRS